MDTTGYPPAVETMCSWGAQDYPSANENHDLGRNLKLPTGYRFHPTDEELVGFYLRKKVLTGAKFGHIGDVDFKCEPSKLPDTTKMDTGECEIRHYFFSPRDRKYPTGMRTDRSTEEGYWKATGKDKEIKDGVSQQIMGMKKTLVFYKGRAPKGIKSNWIMHEYRLEGEGCGVATQKHSSWVVCRVFHKSGSKSLVEANIAAASTTLTAMEVAHSDQTNQTTAQTPATSNNSGSTGDSLPAATVVSAGGSIDVEISKKYQDDAENVDPDSYGCLGYHKHRLSYDNSNVMTTRADVELAVTQGYEVPRSPQDYRSINNYRINLSTSPSSSSTSSYFSQKEMNRGLIMLTPSTLQQHYEDGNENQCHTPTMTKTLRYGNPVSQQNSKPRNEGTTFQDMGSAAAITSSGLISDYHHVEPVDTRLVDMPDMVELPDPFASPIPSWSQLLDENGWPSQ